MALDGACIACIAYELNEKLMGGRIARIAQTESDELQITVKTREANYTLMLSVHGGTPLAVLTERTKNAPMTAPAFCMLLRKHLGNGRLLSVTQPSLERILDFAIEHYDEMGDLKTSHLMMELMGKYSNLILVNDEAKILDSIKRIPASVSSVREVLPGRPYFIPETVEKLDPFSADEGSLYSAISAKAECDASKALYTTLTGFSPFLSEQLCLSCGVDTSVPISEIGESGIRHLTRQTILLIDEIRNKNFSPCMLLRDGVPAEFSMFPLQTSQEETCKNYDSVSRLLEDYYSQREEAARLRQKSADLRKFVQNHLERAVKKLDLQQKQMEDTSKMERFKLCADLLSTYGYEVTPGAKSVKLTSFYDDSEVTIALDETLTPAQNAARYYEKYSKQKRTAEALTPQIAETESEIEYLSSIKTMLEMSTDVENLSEIRKELSENGYGKRNLPEERGASGNKKKKEKKGAFHPLHFRSSTGYDLYVGKNNLQNDELTFQFATGGDLWFHSKNMPGSHVILKCAPKTLEELPDQIFEEAGSLAAYYCSGRDQGKVEIDYTFRKNLKKPPKAHPGFVIYHTNYSMMAKPTVEGLQKIED